MFLNIVKMSVLPTKILRFSSIPIKMPANHFVDINKFLMNFIWTEKTRNSQHSTEERCQRMTLPDFKTYCTAIGVSLVAQWLRICLPVQGTWVRSLVREDPTCRGATKPVCHNY